MERRQLLRGAGMVGVVFGVAAMVAGLLGGELGQLGVGYGLLLLLAAGYLLVGLAIRDAVRARRARSSEAARVTVTGTPSPARR